MSGSAFYHRALTMILAYSSLILEILEAIYCLGNVALHCVDRSLLSLRWHLKVKLWDPDGRVFRFHNTAVHVQGTHYSQLIAYSEVSQLSAKLNLSVFPAAFQTLK